MSEKRNAPVDTGISNKGADANDATSAYEHIIAELFGQVCTRILKLNEKKGADGYGCYDLSITDSCISVFYSSIGECHRDVFRVYRSEIERVGLDTALRSLIEVLDGEGDAE